jgi:hypothetical protein
MKKVLFWLLAIVLVAAGVILLCQAIYFGNLDHTLQMEALGYVKSDITMLTFGQQIAQTFCWLGGMVLMLSGFGAALCSIKVCAK